MNTMQVGMYYNNSKVLVEQMPIPSVGDDEVLIKVMACGVCGSDIMEWYRIKKAPLVLGHELTGEIVQTGKNITAFKVGQKVFTTHHVNCGKCYYCIRGHHTACETFQSVNNHTPGGFSQYLKISGQSLDTGTFVLPDNISYEQGTFIEPLATTVRGLRTAELQPGDSLLIIGSGIIGLIMIKLARALGAGRIIATDISDYRLQAALNYGAEHIVKADQDVPSFIRSVNDGRLADKVMVCTGAYEAACQATECVGKGGILTYFAVPNPGKKISIDFNPFWRDDVVIKTCYGAAPSDNMEAMELLRGKNVEVDDMVTHRFPLNGIGEGFKSASSGENCLKVLILPNQ
ncbi:MAG: alcohol dehydrogenase catalytic domain-containing protein [Desulfobacteraceae bacterium]|nr:alcohol dehydrogenase catalytic domain-containing protein [Desulfobacteraceae bacterium]